MSTPISKAVVTACGLALGLASIAPATAQASVYSVLAPKADKTEKPEPGEGGAKQDDARPPSVDDALESGDLTGAREAARAAREADPTAENWRKEAVALERSGDLAGAVGAYQAYVSALPKQADAERADAEAKIKELKQRARGAVADEPESTHRDDLDKARAKQAAGKAKKRKPRPAVPSTPKDEKIVRKWYFWVTLGAIVAAAGAITGIAIKAATKDEPDSLGIEHAPGPAGPAVFRF